MREQDVAVLRRLYDAFNRRDMPALLDCLDPDVEIVETADLGYAARLLRVLGPRFVVLSGGYRGREEVRRLFETVWAISEWFVVEPQDYVDVGAAIVVPLNLRAKTADGGAEGEATTAHVWTLQGGRARTLRVYAEREDAISAAGLLGDPGAE